MNEQTLVLQIVTVSSARGPIRRTVIAEVEDVVVLAEVNDTNQAKTAGITRFSIGFRRADILSIEGIDKSVCLKHNVQYEQAEHGEAGGHRGDVG
jgi:hypothetical protein